MKFAHKIKPGTKVDLSKIDPSEHAGLSKEEAEERLAELTSKIARLQDLLFAAADTPLLILLQGRDTSGKDGAIRFLLQFMNAQATRIAAFKEPTSIELGHDFLWRIHAQTPLKGETVIFNRSHYEDVLVARVHGLVPEKVWKARYKHINHFEDMLIDAGTVLVKMYLHISKEEQEQRLLDREKDDETAWKLNVGDWKERDYWRDYTHAYEDALSKCSTEESPWHVIPANHKWFRNLAVAEAIHAALEPHKDRWHKDLGSLGQRMKAELAEYRKNQEAAKAQ
jgi:PPK2 family polyphosphate:nucleotide phosphotransferase